ncbi:MAG TPA: RDD family protein [Pedococcus sp.]|jgi:uncharacterized RDD family membrane protein YckC|nr:RDD family protein [Pedococcus sp.]
MDMPTRAGWFDDPADPDQLRYFDGVIWTNHTTPRVTRTAPAPQPAQAQQGPAGWSAPGAQLGQAPTPGGPGQQPQWTTPTYPGMYRRPTTPDGQPLASYGQRVGAFLIDWVIQLAISGILGSYFLVKAFSGYVDAFRTAMNQAQSGQQPDVAHLVSTIDSTALMLYSIVSIVVFAVYQFGFLTRSGRTPGKAAVGISVRLRERPGPPPAEAVLRRVGLPVALFLFQFAPYVGALAVLARALDLLWPAWDNQRQALHDKVAATVVVVGEQPRG